MNQSRYEERAVATRNLGGLLCALLTVGALACGGEDGSDTNTDARDGGARDGGASDAAATGPADVVDEAVLAACPAASQLIESSEWPSCLAGKHMTGKEPFNNMPCELRVGANGEFTYLRGGEVAIGVPARSAWRSGNGTYQNVASVGPRIFLAGIAPDLPIVEGEARVTHLNISIFGLAGQDDKVEIRYLDAALVNQTYNCTLDEQ